MTLSPTGHTNPGAVPRRCSIMLAPFGTIAWRMLISGIRRLREANISEITMPTSSLNSSSTPMISAMASRVMSSCVGPRPPQMMTASASSSVERMAFTMRPKLSPTFTCKHESIPAADSCSPNHDELVSTIWPSSNSVPMATTSQRIAYACLRAFTATAAYCKPLYSVSTVAITSEPFAK